VVQQLHHLTERLEQAEARIASRRRVSGLVVGSLALIAGALWTGHAFSQAACGAATLLPAPFKTMRPNPPPIPADLNGNFKRLIDKFQTGSATVNGAGQATITFPTAFGAVPKILVQPTTAGVVIQVTGRSAQSFQVTAFSMTNFNTAGTDLGSHTHPM